ncbi:hypothetical protein HK102_010279 [Quaeritorhiza haematococci]|nr:hypothetical protein HK102_010279 [Quaeritorhiza haematococci]
MAEEHLCRVFPTHGGYLCQLYVQQTTSSAATPTNLIVILDRSGSMGVQVRRFVNEILPPVCTRLGYKEDDNITLITFDSVAEVTLTSVRMLPEINMTSRGFTYMAGTRDLLEEQLKDTTAQSNVFRILTVSDGEIMDQDLTQASMSQLAALLKHNDLSITSRAVRLMTSDHGSPDTRALSSLLQFNSEGAPDLITVKSTESNNHIIGEIINIFEGDIGSTSQVGVGGAKIRRKPWDKAGTSQIAVRAGERFVWLDGLPTEITIDGKVITFNVSEAFLDRETYSKMLQRDIDIFVRQARVLKVVNTKNSLEEINRIAAYFEQLEKAWFKLEESDNSNPKEVNTTSLRYRMQMLKKMITNKRQTISLMFAEIANDSLVTQLNAAQQADYLRTASGGRNAKGLAKRAAASSGLDFTSIVHREVRQMHANLDKLRDIDDSSHLTSFVAFDTTLGGIKTVCELVDQDILDECSALEVLQLFNVVGIPVAGPVGDYPDGSTYRITEMFFDCHASVADLLTALENAGSLETPGTKAKFTNVIPVFDDVRIATFLRSYAPTMMEYLASLGMRRMIAEVPMTAGYTTIAAVWKLVEEINKHQATVKIAAFLQLVEHLVVVAGGYFKFVQDLLEAGGGSSDKAFHLDNNGLMNVMVPLCKMLQNGKVAEMPRILRALFTHEVWQAVRKRYRNSQDAQEVMSQMVVKLMSIDFGEYEIPLQPLFVEEPKTPDINAKTEVNDGYLEEILRDCWFVDYLSLLPTYLGIAVDPVLSFDKKIDALKSVSPMTETSVAEALQIDTTLKRFKFVSVMQAIAHPHKKSRIDDKTGTTILPDPANSTLAQGTIKMLVNQQYLEHYNDRCAKKTAKENEILIGELVDALLTAPTVEIFVATFRSGITKGCRNITLTNTSSPAFEPFFSRLVSPAKPFLPYHADKLAITISGIHDGEPVWNGGNVLRPLDTPRFAEVFNMLEASQLWEDMQDDLRNRSMHIYRAGKSTNRHGHGNDRQSYWALGYQSMVEFESKVSRKVFEDYCANHKGCCGLPA